MDIEGFLNIVVLIVLMGVIIYGFLGLILYGLAWFIHLLLTNKFVQGAFLFSIAYLIFRLLFSSG